MDQNRYIFDDAQDAAELRRLELLESVFDERTRQWLRASGTLAGSRCLEVGAGAGSIAAWLASEVGAAGRVVAIDTNLRFLERLAPAVRVVECKLGREPAPEHSFDLVHARYVLIHNDEPGPMIDEMLRALKPGGKLILEEPDFSAARAFTGPVRLRRAFDAITQAIQATFAARGMDYAFGSLLPRMIEERPTRIGAIDYECQVVPGGHDFAEMMRMSALALRDKYVTTGVATASDVDSYAEFARSPECRAAYYATVRILAHKAEE